MTNNPNPNPNPNPNKDLLRLLTCGSVDDGKSTLIGRMLYETGQLPEDTLAQLREDSKVHGTVGGDFDPALVTDGLQAEREQGITIDVAYRYFSTDKRAFILADTPGHVQYTRNMATGASTASLAIILIDARTGLTEQTKRHTFLVSQLGIKHVVVAINKMDLADYSQDTYESIRKDYISFASKLQIDDLHCIPISALKGDNVVAQSAAMPWYKGTTLLNHLETVHIASDRNVIDFRFPVQLVNRPHLDYRGYAGTVASGSVRVGDEVTVLPSKKVTKVASIDTYNGQLQQAFAGQAVTLTLEDEVDVSRGDMIVPTKNVPNIDTYLDAMLVWMSDQPLLPNKEYLLKCGTKEVKARVDTIQYKINMSTLRRESVPQFTLNDIGRCQLKTVEPVVFDAYSHNRATGAFILIDPENYNTLAAGMVLDRQTLEQATHDQAAHLIVNGRNELTISPSDSLESALSKVEEILRQMGVQEH